MQVHACTHTHTDTDTNVHSQSFKGSTEFSSGYISPTEVMPADTATDFDAHLQQSIMALQKFNSEMSKDVVILYSAQDIPAKNENDKIHPAWIHADLEKDGEKDGYSWLADCVCVYMHVCMCCRVWFISRILSLEIVVQLHDHRHLLANNCILPWSLPWELIHSWSTAVFSVSVALYSKSVEFLRIPNLAQ